MKRIEFIWISAIGATMAGIIFGMIIGSSFLYWIGILILGFAWIISEIEIQRNKKGRDH